MGLFLRRANGVRPYDFVAVSFSLFYSIFKLRSGCDIWYYVPGFAYTEYHNARPRPDTSTLQPVPESLIVFTKSQGLYVPASIKTLSTYTRKRGALLHKKCNNCRNVAKLKDKSFVCTSLVVRICAVVTQNYYRNIDENTRKKLCLCSYPTILIYINICDFNKKQLTNRGGLVYYYIVIV